MTEQKQLWKHLKFVSQPRRKTSVYKLRLFIHILYTCTVSFFSGHNYDCKIRYTLFLEK